MAKVEKALYGLLSSGWLWHSHLAGTLWTLGFKPARYDQDEFLHQIKVGSVYDYVSCHTNYLIVVVSTQEILDSLMKICKVHNLGPPAYNLGCNYSKVVNKGEEYWCIGSSTHIKNVCIKAEEILSKLYNIQGYKIEVKTKKCERAPISADSHPEMDE